jgi:hypothetical protein
LGPVGAGALVGVLLVALPDGGGSPPSAPAAATGYSVAGHQIRLEVQDSECWLLDRFKRGEERRLRLDLRSPCYVVTWHEAPPRVAAHESDAVPVGQQGSPKAFRYKVAGGTVALAVIGDPPTPDPRPESLYQLRRRSGYHCTDSLRGVRLRGGRVQLLPKAQGLFCEEAPPDEKDYWMIAHD